MSSVFIGWFILCFLFSIALTFIALVVKRHKRNRNFAAPVCLCLRPFSCYFSLSSLFSPPLLHFEIFGNISVIVIHFVIVIYYSALCPLTPSSRSLPCCYSSSCCPSSSSSSASSSSFFSSSSSSSFFFVVVVFLILLSCSSSSSSSSSSLSSFPSSCALLHSSSSCLVPPSSFVSALPLSLSR